MAWVMYRAAKHALLEPSVQANVDYETATFKLMLLTSAYTPSNSHDYEDDLTANEVSGSGYTAGGVAISNPTVGVTGSLGSAVVKFDASDPAVFSQNSSGFSNAQFVVLKAHVGSSTSANPLIAYYNLGSTYGNVAGDLTITFSASSGILTLT